MVKIGQQAPEFKNIPAYQKGKDFLRINLSDFRGRWVVLFFYPRDFTFICPTEIKEFSRLEKEFEKGNCVIVAASTDSEHSHKAWFERDLKDVRYPILADTTQQLSRDYNVLDESGASQRGTFIIDPQGMLAWMMVSGNSIGRSVKEVLRALQAAQTGELCPVEWEPGQKTLGN